MPKGGTVRAVMSASLKGTARSRPNLAVTASDVKKPTTKPDEVG